MANPREQGLYPFLFTLHSPVQCLLRDKGLSFVLSLPDAVLFKFVFKLKVSNRGTEAAHGAEWGWKQVGKGNNGQWWRIMSALVVSVVITCI